MDEDLTIPRVSGRGDRIEIDCTTSKKGGSSSNQFVDDPDTEVYYGHQVSVCMKVRKDLWLRVCMDPYKGNWKDAKFARAEAMKCLKENLTLSMLADIFEIIRRDSMEKGGASVRSELRGLLGIEDEGRGGHLFLKG